MGNEFGHPEWLDFPRRRMVRAIIMIGGRWNLADDQNLLYRWVRQYRFGELS